MFSTVLTEHIVFVLVCLLFLIKISKLYIYLIQQSYGRFQQNHNLQFVQFLMSSKACSFPDVIFFYFFQNNTSRYPYPESVPSSYPSSETTPRSYQSSHTLPSNQYPSNQTLTSVTDYPSSQNLPTSYPPYATIRPHQERTYPANSSSSSPPSDVNYSTIDFDPSSSSNLDQDGYEKPMSLAHEKPTSHLAHEKPTSHLAYHEKPTSHRSSTDSKSSSFLSHTSWASLDRNGFLRKSKGKKGNSIFVLLF